VVLLGGKEVCWAFVRGLDFLRHFCVCAGLVGFAFFCIYCMDGIGLVLDTTGLRKLEVDGWLGKGKGRKRRKRHNRLACITAILL